MLNMPKVNNDDTRTTSIDVIQISYHKCDTSHVAIIRKHLTLSKQYLIINIFYRFFCSINFMFGCGLVCFVEIAIRRCIYKKICLSKIYRENLGKELSF